MINVKTDISQPAESGIYTMHRYIQACQWLGQHTGSFFGSLLMRGRHMALSVADVEPGMRYVIAANHQTYLDPWVVPGQISWSIWQKLGAPRSFVANRFFNYPVVGTFLRSMGSFPARAHPRDPYGLDYAIHHLDHDRSVIIFPEGRLSRQRQFPAHKGVMVLAQQPNVRVIPVHIEWRKNRLGLYVFDIGVGKPFNGSQMSAPEILQHIYDLPTS